MALPANAVIEIRSTATAGNVNGGGFNSARGGTDYTLQDTAQVNGLTDGTSSASTTFTSASATFTSQMVGNFLHLTAGTGATIGFYEVVTYVDAHTITLDAASGTYTNGTFYIGGALSLQHSSDTAVLNGMAGGYKLWVKAGTYTLASNISISTAGGAQAPIIFEGYNTSRGDDPTGTNRPLFACAGYSFQFGNNWDIYNISGTGTSANGLYLGTGGKAVNCRFINQSSTTNRYAINGNTDQLVINCEAVSYRGRGIQIGRGLTFGNYIHDSDIGLWPTSGSNVMYISGNIVENCITAGFSVSVAQISRCSIMNNTFYGAENKLGTGISMPTGTTHVSLFGNIIYGYVTGVSHADASQTVGYDDYNDYYNNTTDNTNWTKGANDQALDPQFASVSQVTGTNGKFNAGGGKLIDTTMNFTSLGVSAGDVVNITVGSGITAGLYYISSISTTTNPNDTLNITIPASPGTNITEDKHYQITLGHNFVIGTNLKAKGFPGAFQGGFTTGYMDTGAVQRQEAGGASSGFIGGNFVI